MQVTLIQLVALTKNQTLLMAAWRAFEKEMHNPDFCFDIASAELLGVQLGKDSDARLSYKDPIAEYCGIELSSSEKDAERMAELARYGEAVNALKDICRALDLGIPESIFMTAQQ